MVLLCWFSGLNVIGFSLTLVSGLYVDRIGVVCGSFFGSYVGHFLGRFLGNIGVVFWVVCGGFVGRM